jgi:hypothetical protein
VVEETRLTFRIIHAPKYFNAEMPTMQHGIPALSSIWVISRISSVPCPLQLAFASPRTPKIVEYLMSDMVQSMQSQYTGKERERKRLGKSAVTGSLL